MPTESSEKPTIVLPIKDSKRLGFKMIIAQLICFWLTFSTGVLEQGSPACPTEVRFASFLSGGFTTMAVINPPERKLVKRTSVDCGGLGKEKAKENPGRQTNEYYYYITRQPRPFLETTPLYYTIYILYYTSTYNRHLIVLSIVAMFR